MSVLDELRKRREEIRSKDRHLDYEVPGYGGDLVVRFNPAPYAAVVAYYTTFDAEGLLKADADAIVKSCREILVKEDDKLEPIVLGEQTTFGTVDEALGFEAATAVDAVFEVFPSDLSVGECSAELIGWSRTIDEEADEDILGKSEGGTTSS